MDKPAVVVGVDGSATAQHALEWAAAEATRRAAPLVIAYGGDAGGDASADFGRSLLAEAQASVFESDADCTVRTVLSERDPLGLLTELSHGAELVVVGSHGLGRVAGALLGSTAFEIAGHARCPVAIVAHALADAGAQPSTGVVVGMSAHDDGQGALAFAFAEADRRGEPLTVVSTWSRIDLVAEGADLLYESGERFAERFADRAGQVLAPLRQAHPSVSVTTEFSERAVGIALHEACEHAQLLVLGCRFTDGHSYSRLGPVTSAIVHHPPCRVVVVVGNPAPVLAPGPA
jgi:nucleotide-binding universal stress UspA family protein